MWKIYYCLSILALILQSCIIKYDALKYYVDGYKPNNSTISTNGYYFTQSDSIHLKGWPNAVAEFYLFEDGSFEFGSNSENVDSLDKWICKFPKTHFSYGPFGFYKLENDTISIEYIVTDFPGFTKATRYDIKAVQSPNGIRFFELNGKPYAKEYVFRQNPCVPSTVKNWLKKHRKYKLQEL